MQLILVRKWLKKDLKKNNFRKGGISVIVNDFNSFLLFNERRHHYINTNPKVTMCIDVIFSKKLRVKIDET